MKRILAYSPVLDLEIRKLVAQKKSEVARSGSWQSDFLDRLLPFATAGKLLRGSLLCFNYEAFAGQPPDKTVIRTAAALELIHSALLIHDDVMDNDDFRRGKPSLHRQYETFANEAGLSEPARFGSNLAICGADMCLFLAFGLLSAVPQTVNDLFVRMLTEVCDGQMQDIYLQVQPKIPSKRAVYNLMRTKTAAYTVSLPLTAGAALAGQPLAVRKRLRRIGDAAGIIFQIRDDELGVLGDTARTGKPVGADIREGKKTLIYYYLMKKCSSAEKKCLKAIFGNTNLTPGDTKTVQKLIKQHRIPQLLNAEVRSLESGALKAVDALDLPVRYKTELKSLIAFCAKRQT